MTKLTWDGTRNLPSTLPFIIVCHSRYSTCNIKASPSPRLLPLRTLLHVGQVGGFPSFIHRRMRLSPNTCSHSSFTAFSGCSSSPISEFLGFAASTGCPDSHSHSNSDPLILCCCVDGDDNDNASSSVPRLSILTRASYSMNSATSMGRNRWLTPGAEMFKSKWNASEVPLFKWGNFFINACHVLVRSHSSLEGESQSVLSIYSLWQIDQSFVDSYHSRNFGYCHTNYTRGKA